MLYLHPPAWKGWVTAVLMLGLLGVGCDDDPGDPIQPLACKMNHTATFTGTNGSRRSVYDVVVGGVIIGTIRPGEQVSREVTAGNHRLVFGFSNSAQTSCNPVTIPIAQCSAEELECRGDL